MLPIYVMLSLMNIRCLRECWSPLFWRVFRSDSAIENPRTACAERTTSAERRVSRHYVGQREAIVEHGGVPTFAAGVKESARAQSCCSASTYVIYYSSSATFEMMAVAVHLWLV